ncbi:TraK family protein [Desulforhopalus singaporensis]|uniref:TraK protein n=1 Tax=Desulforhopalus singaporensis TaxID=91360 RepID=A0A1H0S3B0_9BACT|nr:TraK family protein [Desulforhopalus singaporensis]SDP36200.1 hypothetical protein SAMN05660330_02514 [Desulforhopalus singaporensis]
MQDLPIRSNCHTQFLVVKDYVTRQLERQQPVKRIWKYLKDQGKITMSYQAFWACCMNPDDPTPFSKKAKVKIKRQVSGADTVPIDPPAKPQRRFEHDPTPLPVDFDFNEKKKEGK